MNSCTAIWRNGSSLRHIGTAVEGWKASVFPGDMHYKGQYTIVKILKEVHISALYQAYENGVIEVGNINFSDALKRTTISTEAHQLLASYVFDELGYRRYEWKCDALNAPSIKMAKRLGFTYEGTFRNVVIYKGRERNTCWFSMLQEEWPTYKEAIEKWLASENFDEKGIQIRKLEEFR